MRHGSLFSGIGGFDLAAEWMGWENVFHCEWNEFGQKVLNYYWPNAISYGDITKTDFTIHRGSIDILTGGFPCQPYSAAGKRLGKEDERHLWPEMLRAIREISPRWIVGENVRGLVNWSGGLVFDEVQADLEAEGYEVLPFILPACGKDAPHKRERVWFVAHAKGDGDSEWKECCRREDKAGEEGASGTDVVSAIYRDAAHAANSEPVRGDGLEKNDAGQGKRGGVHKRRGGGNDWNVPTPNPNGPTAQRNRIKGKPGSPGKGGDKQSRIMGISKCTWETFPTQSPVCGRDDGLSSQLDGIAFPKWRRESIKGYGNAVVPQVVFEIFKAIEAYEKIGFE